MFCSPELLQRKTTGKYVSCIVVAGLNRFTKYQVDNTDQTIIHLKLSPSRLEANYYCQLSGEALLPNPSLLDPIDSEQQNEVRPAMEDMQKAAFDDGPPFHKHPALTNLLSDRRDIFCTSFSVGPSLLLLPFRIELTLEARHVKVQLRNYWQSQRDVLSKDC